MATLACEIEVGRQLMMHCAELAADGITPPEYGAISKVFSGELMERFGEAALDILGMRATLSEQMPGALDNGRFEQNLRHSLMWVISIGTNEIQRSLIAQRGAWAAQIGVIGCRSRRPRPRRSRACACSIFRSCWPVPIARGCSPMSAPR